MSKMLSILLAAGLLLYPFATYAADYGSQPSQNQQVPPVAQPLVREGDFAVKLAAQLGLGSPTDEAAAEDMLAKAGIAPQNGWISDYPITPQIIGQIQSSLDTAAAGGQLPVSVDEAKNGLNTLAAQLNLPLPGGSAPQEAQAEAPAEQTSPTINNYYYNEGPPAITYYPPPPAYGYLYDWVPFPAVWSGLWFPGFFICHNFTTVVTVSPFFDHHLFFRAIVSNQIIDPFTRSFVRVDAVVRTGNGRIRPDTVLRSVNGRTFRTVSEFRHDSVAIAPHVGKTAITNTIPGMMPRTATRNAETMRNRTFALNKPAPAPVSPRAPQRSFNSPSSGRTMRSPMMSTPQRPFNVPSPGKSSILPSRSFNSAAGGRSRMGAINVPQRPLNVPSPGRLSISPRMPQRSFTGPRSFSGPMTGFSGSRMGGMRSFSGTSGRAAGGFSHGSGPVGRR